MLDVLSRPGKTPPEEKAGTHAPVRAGDPRRYIRIHADLRAKIADGRLPSGTLLNMGTLADDYDVARETVQRAIRMLADEDLVTRYPGLGWQVN